MNGRSWALPVLVAGLGPHPVAGPAQTPSSPQATFTKDVAPILQRSCVTCHRPGGSAPMSLMTYEDARPFARAIKTRTTTREMPPWLIDRTATFTKPGEYVIRASASDRMLTTTQKVKVSVT